MTSRPYDQGGPNRLLLVSLEHPVLMMLALYVLAYLIKVLDTIVLRLDELVGEAILTKALGFLLVAVYVWACGRSLRDIGFHRRGLGRSLLMGAIPVVLLFAIAYIAQLIALSMSGREASLALSAIDPKSGMEGGLLFGLWLVLANFVNSAMEEGLFRGAMVRHFRIPYAFWGAILLQALLFAIWHLSWPVEMLLTGEGSLGEAGMQAFGLFLATGISGLVYGYLYAKTDNLWGPFLAHTINNTVTNMLFIRTASGLQGGFEFGVFLAVWLPGYLLLIPIFGWLAKRWQMPEVKPWGEFDRKGALRIN
jgi:membrane protease YdiL (CAAX protease family)